MPEPNRTPWRPDPVFAAKLGMFRTCDDIDNAKERHDPVAIANARTSMDDYRLALAMALGRPCDRNGYEAVDELTADVVPGSEEDLIRRESRRR